MNIKDVIDTYSLTEQGNNNAFQTLRDAATVSADVQDFKDECLVAENDYMVSNFANDSDAKKKSGEWKFRTYLPNSYTSSKSVIVTAMTLGIPLYDQGKTALQKAIKDIKSSNVKPKSPFERCMSAIRTLDKEMNNITSLQELADVKDELTRLNLI